MNVGRTIPRSQDTNFQPVHMHHPDYPAQMAMTLADKQRLEREGWSTEYTHKPYPKAKYHPKLAKGTEKSPARVVQDADAEKALGKGWYNSPDEFPESAAEAPKNGKGKGGKGDEDEAE